MNDFMPDEPETSDEPPAPDESIDGCDWALIIKATLGLALITCYLVYLMDARTYLTLGQQGWFTATVVALWVFSACVALGVRRRLPNQDDGELFLTILVVVLATASLVLAWLPFELEPRLLGPLAASKFSASVLLTRYPFVDMIMTASLELAIQCGVVALVLLVWRPTWTRAALAAVPVIAIPLTVWFLHVSFLED
ncbi:MAG: hypothetical protein N2C14_11540 [Planctomycetales bacterium]